MPEAPPQNPEMRPVAGGHAVHVTPDGLVILQFYSAAKSGVPTADFTVLLTPQAAIAMGTNLVTAGGTAPPRS